jgi:hypothetical protein
MGKSEYYGSYNIISENGTFIIYVGSDGKIHIRLIRPDPPPDISALLKAVSLVMHEASQLKDQVLAEQFRQFAENLLNSRANELGGLLANTAAA